jgi:hypothetical protein
MHCIGLGITGALRCTVSDHRHQAWLNKMGFNQDWIERQLSHQERNKVRAAYHREQYLEERHYMMQRWADFVDELVSKNGAKISASKQVVSDV